VDPWCVPVVAADRGCACRRQETRKLVRVRRQRLCVSSNGGRSKGQVAAMPVTRPARGEATDGNASPAVPYLTITERTARGTAARAEVPRSSHTVYEPAAARPNPIELLERQAQTRVPELVPIRYGRMFSTADERERWDDYRAAFSEVLSRTSSEWASWYVIPPADRKWFGRIGAAAALVQTLMEIDPRFPPVSKQQHQALLELKGALEAQARKGAAPDPFERHEHHANDGKINRGDGQPAARGPASAAAEASEAARGR
jgi:Polyphosphate kinase 2 (PPK2)